jgi:hypothetical protein
MENNITSHQKQELQQNSTMRWLETLLSAVRIPSGETYESLRLSLFLYKEALESDAHLMTKDSLIDAIRSFDFFPSPAKLAEFFECRRYVPPTAATGKAVPAPVDVDTRDAWWQDHPRWRGDKP